MLVVGLLIFIGLMFAGVPIWLTMVVSGTFLTIFLQGLPPTTIPLLLFSSLDSFVLLAVPFFLLGGNIMAFCGPSKYIFRAIEGYFGHIPGGLPFATVVSCMVYAAITGSTTATIVAIGTIAIPPMIAAGYPKSFCTGLMANSATIGQMIPPSVYMILYGAMVQEDVGVLFISGVIPGLIIGFAMAFLAAYIAVKQKFKLPPRASKEVRRKALVRGLPAILMPVLVLGGIYTGIFTPTEAAGISCVYSFAIAAFYYRELTWQNFKQAVTSSVAATSMIFMIVASVILYAGPLTFAGIPQAITNTIIGYGMSADMVLVLIVIGLAGVRMLSGPFTDHVPDDSRGFAGPEAFQHQPGPFQRPLHPRHADRPGHAPVRDQPLHRERGLPGIHSERDPGSLALPPPHDRSPAALHPGPLAEHVSAQPDPSHAVT